MKIFSLVKFSSITMIFVTLFFFSYSSFAMETVKFPVILQDPTIDGIITDNEYAFNSSFSNDDFILHWTISSDEIYFGMIGNTLGYLALGIEPTAFMKDADMVIGWVFSNSTVNVTDAFSTGNFGPHPPDVSLGGTADLLDYNGSESLSSTTIEFRRLMVTGDIYDTELSANSTIEILWALSNSDSFTASHSSRGSGIIDLSQGISTDTSLPSLWIFHAIFMTLGFVSMLSGIVIARFFKKKKWRIKTHRRVSLFASITSITGLVLSLVMVSEHLTIVHHFFGIIAIPFIAIMPILGYIFTNNLQNIPILKQINPYRKTIRKVHRLVGYITFLLMLGSIISGLIRAFG